MTGAVIITHGTLAAGLADVAETISGDIEGVRTVSVNSSDATERIRDDLAKAVEESDDGDGVVIFTDMFGGTPSNIALSLFESGRVEVVTGVNLPMIIKFLGHRDKPLGELALLLKESGRESIILAGDMLKDE